MVTLDLPEAPSTNRLWRKVGARIVKSESYRKWIAEAGWRLKEQKPRPIKGPVEISVLVGKSRGDLDNRCKSIFDLLVLHGVIEDDGPDIVRRIHLALDDAVEGCRITIKPFATTGAQALWG